MNWEVNLVKQNPRTAVVLSIALITVLVVGTLLFAMVGGEDSLPHFSPTSNNISAHVLDISTGQPARGINCTTYKHKEDDQWVELGTTTTDAKGRIGVVHPNVSLSEGVYKLRFATNLTSTCDSSPHSTLSLRWYFW
uniref:Transthyretin/hydroxyisourate hydrolase domain-containing protein n=1 Tax=Ditylenchus dipsaci TaxID=166011 RepID=A0A915DDC2_9BILA